MPSISEPGRLDELASVLERSIEEAARTAGQPGAVAASVVEVPGQKKEGCLGASSAIETSGGIASEGSAGEVDGKHLSVTDVQAVTIVRRNFVGLVLKLMVGDMADDFPRHFARDFVSDQVYARLPESTSADAVVAMCESLGVVDDTYEKTLSTLMRIWNEVWPEIKAESHNYLKNSILSRDANLLPPLTLAEIADLNVRWYEADREYEREEQEAFARCGELGYDVGRDALRRGDVSAVLGVLARLLEKRVRIDKAQVLRDGAKLNRVNRTRIWERLRRLCHRLVEPIREAVAGMGIHRYSQEVSMRQQMEEDYEKFVMNQYQGIFRSFNQRMKRLERSLGFEDPIISYYKEYFRLRPQGL